MSNLSVTFNELLPKIKTSLPIVVSLSVVAAALFALVILGPILKHTVDKSNHIINIAQKFLNEHGGWFKVLHDPALSKQWEILCVNPYIGPATGETFATMGLCATAVIGIVVAAYGIKRKSLEIQNEQTQQRFLLS